MGRLVACAACARHFRTTEERCPFCGTDSAESVASARARVVPRLDGRPLTRAAILFATAAATSGTAAACGKTTADPDAAIPEPTYPAPPYGVAPFDAALLEPPPPPPPPTDASVITHPVAVPPYGVAPPFDAGALRKPPPKR